MQKATMQKSSQFLMAIRIRWV